MASSGNFTTNTYDAGGNTPKALRFEWWTNSRSTQNNSTTIGFALKTDGGNSASWVRIRNTSLVVDGQTFTCGTITGYGAGATTLISGTKTIYHNNDGSRSFSASCSAGFVYNTINVSGSGSWALDKIERFATITGCSGDRTDEQDFTFNFSNPGSLSVSFKLELPDLGYDPLFARENVTSAGSGTYTMELTDTERETLLDAMKNSKSTKLRYTVYSQIGGEYNYSYQDATLSIAGGAPTFSDFTYKDIDEVATALTSDNQKLIQSISTLQVEVTKATANKGATISGYTISISGASEFNAGDLDSSPGKFTHTLASSDQIQSGLQTLSVRATDSRGNFTVINKNVQVLPYTQPSITVSAERAGGFEDETTMKIKGSISLINDGDENLNAVKALWYRTRKQGESEWGDPQYLDNFELDAESGEVSVQDKVISLDNSYAWDIEAGIADKIIYLSAGLDGGTTQSAETGDF